MEGPKGKDAACLLAMVDRMSRKTIVIKLPDLTQKSVIEALDTFERKIGTKRFADTFKKIIVDDGSEFLNHKQMEMSLKGNKKRTNIFFVTLIAPGNVGPMNQTNGMIRRFIPKGTPISSVLKREVKEIENWLNNYPRRILNGKSSLQMEALEL